MPINKPAAKTFDRKPDRNLPSGSQISTDPVFWTAWLYHEQGLKQDDIARHLGCSRASVFNLLQRARDEGIVNITLDTRRLQQSALAFELIDSCGLDECHVMPTCDSTEPMSQQLGRFGARILEQRIAAEDVIGVSWGRTVLALSQSLSRTDRPSVTVAQINGSGMATFDFSPEFCTSNIARRLNARCANLLAPGVVSSSTVKDLLMQEPLIQQHFNLLQQCTMTLFGVTHLGSETLLGEKDFMSDEQLAGYKAHQAVGIASGYFFDIDGNIVVQEFDGRYIVMPLQDFLNVKQRLCIGGGLEKVDAITGMLRARLVSALIIDEQTALKVCERLRELNHGTL